MTGEFITSTWIYHSGLAPGALFANYVSGKKQKFNYFSTTFTQCSRLKRRKPKGNAVKAGRELSSFAAAHFVAVAALGLVDYFSRLFGAPAAAYKM